MTFFKKFFKKTNYNQITICNYCDTDSTEEKTKKCDDCSSHICVECYAEHKLCYNCNEKYDEWANSLQKVKISSLKEKKYNTKEYKYELDLSHTMI
tara:strand:- start:260 stop:547 length:288 start_codon:yes stop_codon:yes gene_type:complete